MSKPPSFHLSYEDAFCVLLTKKNYFTSPEETQLVDYAKSVVTERYKHILSKFKDHVVTTAIINCGWDVEKPLAIEEPKSESFRSDTRMFTEAEVKQIMVDVMNMGLQLRQHQLNGSTDKTGNDVIKAYWDVYLSKH